MNFIIPLFSEDGTSLSLGRIMLLVLFGFMTYFWFVSEWEIPPTLVTTFEWLLAYNFGKKLVEVANNFVISKK